MVDARIAGLCGFNLKTGACIPVDVNTACFLFFFIGW